MSTKLALPLLVVLPDKPGDFGGYWDYAADGLAWENGRQLASASATVGDTTVDLAYTYDINGLRTSKTITRTTGGSTAHTHEYTSAVTAPTCTTAGYTTYTCECGESYVDNLVDALGHNYVKSGNIYTCTRCGDSYAGHEHSYTEQTTEPTCLAKGYTVYTCSCGDTYTVEIPALGHNYVLVNQTGNVATYRCSRCGHRYTAVVPVIPNPPVEEYRLRSGNDTVTTEHHEYVYASGKLLREIITTTANGNTTTQTLDFTYDTSGNPYTLTYTNGTANPVTYYYIVNLQGDVIRLVSGTGVTVAEYAYDPWGKVTSAIGTMAEINPLRYRGYYYDAETKFYYLQSRYYDPVICRFVNADGYASTGQGFLGWNMFAYCLNSPISLNDSAGLSAVLNNTVVICDGGSRMYFDDIVDAALMAAISARERTDADNNEHGRVIYESESGRYYLGHDIVGEHDRMSFGSVPGVKNGQLPDNVAAVVHSHPNCNGHEGNVFSPQDAYFVEMQQLNLYLAAPNGWLYILTPEETVA